MLNIIGLNYGISYYCVYGKQLTKELMVARPLKSWRLWLRGFSYKIYPSMKMSVITLSGFEFHQKIS